MKHTVALAAGALLAFVGAATAISRPIPAKVVVVKPNKLVKVLSKDHGQPVPAVDALDDPTWTSATLTFRDLGAGGGTVSFQLHATGWSAVKGGYKYKGKKDVLDPNPKGTCRVVLFTESKIKAVCKDDGLGAIDLTTPFTGAASVILATANYEYCAELGGDEKKNDAAGLKRKDAPAPGGCPVAHCPGYEYEGGCWFDAAFLNCDAECAAHGMLYSELTRTVAGSDGTDEHCQALIAHFGWPQPFVAVDFACGGGYGCARDDSMSTRCVSPPTNSITFATGRMCACE